MFSYGNPELCILFNIEIGIKILIFLPVNVVHLTSVDHFVI